VELAKKAQRDIATAHQLANQQVICVPGSRGTFLGTKYRRSWQIWSTSII